MGISGLVLDWTAAEDDVGVTAYRVFQDGVQVQELGNVTSADVTGLSAETGYDFQVQAGDAAGNWSTDGPSLTVTTARDLPPDPADIAPALNPTVATSLGSAVEFLYTGDDPIQKGVDPQDIDPSRVAVLRGQVLDEDGQALPGATVKILGRPEFGWTVSRADGRYDLVVNGGEHLVVRAEREDFLASQRKLYVPWRDYVAVAPMRLVPPDGQVTTIDLSGGAQVARGSQITDEDGVRQAALLLPAGVQAELKMPDGSSQALTSMSLRATEYTVGAGGPERMPAGLPANSAYTYALDLSLDEARQAGAEVEFDRPLYFYLDNFLGFPAGTTVPMGYYDDDRGVWVPSDSGKVVDIVEVDAGVAALDVDGDGQADSGAALDELGITGDELGELGQMYAAGDSLWRVGVTHFSSYDCNWGVSPPADGRAPDATPEDLGDEGGCEQGGSVIDCPSQVLGEDIALAGLPFGLHYRSSRVRGRLADYSLDIPLRGPEVPASLKRIDLAIDVAGRHEEHEYESDPDPNSPWDLHHFTWNGLDAYGRPVQGKAPISLKIGWVYDAVYQQTGQFGNNGNGVEITGDNARDELTLWTHWKGSIGAMDARGLGLGGWTLGIHHFYDPNGRVLYRGDGTSQRAESFGQVIETIAGGTFSWSDDEDGGPAIGAGVGYPGDMEIGPNGELYIINWGNLLKVEGGRIYRLAGGSGSYEDGIPARDAQLNRGVGLAYGGGSFYIAEDTNCRIRMIDMDGIITTIAGTRGECGFSGDGAPAVDAQLDHPHGLVLSPDGSLYIADYGNSRIRKIDTRGMISTVIGNGDCTSPTDGTPAADATVCQPTDLELGPDGSLYFIDNSNRVYAIGPDGIVRVVAGDGSIGYSGDGGPATEAQIGWPTAIEVDKKGELYIFQSLNKVVRLVGADGIIQTYAGGGSEFVEKGPAIGSGFEDPNDLVVGQEGELYMSNSNDSAIRRVTFPFKGHVGQEDFVIPARDGKEVYVFDPQGRHKQTLQAMTGAALWTFAYDNHGLLMNITDAYGNVVLIQRDGQGKPTAIVSPWGVTTSVSVDDDGYLESVTDPSGNTHGFTYGPGGLLASMADPNQGQYAFEYDSLGRLTKDSDPATGFKELTRDEQDQGTNTFVQVTTAEGRVTGYRNRLLTTGVRESSTVFPDGQSTHATIGNDASVDVTYPDRTDVHAQAAPDPRFGMSMPYTSLYTITTPAGLVYDLQASREATLLDNDPFKPTVTDTVSVNGDTFLRSYDHASRTWTLTTPEGRSLSIQVDENGRPTSSTIAGSGLYPISYSYDEQGRLQAVSQGTGDEERVLTLSYDGEGFVGAITDPEARTVSFARDQAGRISSQVLPDQREIGLDHDANGNLTAVTPPGRPEHQMGYSPVDLLDAYDPPALPSGGGPTEWEHDLDRLTTRVLRPDGGEVTFGRATDGLLHTVTSSAGVTRIGYDPSTQKLQTIVTADGVGLDYVWDGPLLTEERMSFDGLYGSVSTEYDDYLRPSAQSVSPGRRIALGYDADGLLTSAGDLSLTRDPSHGLVTGSSLYEVSTSSGYNAFGEPASYLAQASGTTLYDVAYLRDRLGRIVEKTETIEGATSVWGYHYDTAGRLDEVQRDGLVVEAYTYDSNSNRLTASDDQGLVAEGTYDDQDRLLSYGDADYTYTDAGDLQSKTDASGTTYYQYDELGNLRYVTLSDGTAIDYVIDGRNRRVGKMVGGTLVQGFLYKDQLEPVAELDGQGNLVSQFIYAEKSNVPTYMIRGASFYRIVTDQVGSVRLVVDASNGQVVQRMDYDSFGRVVLDTNPGFQPFGFAGGPWDRDAELVRFGMRDYSPDTGRWTTKDVLFFWGGDTNLFVYAQGDPTNRIDLSGLSDVTFDRSSGTITVYDSQGQQVGQFSAGNNTTRSSNGPWPNGTYNFSHYNRHAESGSNGPYGSNGNFVFTVPGRPGMGIHSGRRGPQSRTLGCIRTTDQATSFLRNLQRTDPLRTLMVQQ